MEKNKQKKDINKTSNVDFNKTLRDAEISRDMMYELATDLIDLPEFVRDNIEKYTSILNRQKNDSYYIPKALVGMCKELIKRNKNKFSEEKIREMLGENSGNNLNAFKLFLGEKVRSKDDPNIERDFIDAVRNDIVSPNGAHSDLFFADEKSDYYDDYIKQKLDEAKKTRETEVLISRLMKMNEGKE